MARWHGTSRQWQPRNGECVDWEFAETTAGDVEKSAVTLSLRGLLSVSTSGKGSGGAVNSLSGHGDKEHGRSANSRSVSRPSAQPDAIEKGVADCRCSAVAHRRERNGRHQHPLLLSAIRFTPPTRKTARPFAAFFRDNIRDTMGKPTFLAYCVIAI